MSKKTAGRKSVPDRALVACLEALAAWEDGAALGQILPRDPVVRCIVQNTLLTLFRHRAVLDWLIDRCADGKVRPRIRRVLRWGVCQVVYLDGLSAAAATDCCVRYVHRRYHKREAGFANAILRRLTDKDAADWQKLARTEGPPAVRLSLSPELISVWSKRFSEGELTALSATLEVPAPLTIRLRAGADDTCLPAYLEQLPAFEWSGGQSMFRCQAPRDLFGSELFARGEVYVQDPSTLLAPALLVARPGECIADLCSAPGGKSVLLAEAMEGRGLLVCGDRSRRRLRRVQQNLAGHGDVCMTVADGACPPFRIGSFDGVLLDVPCSNTGVIRRRPDVRWRFSRKGLGELVLLQKEILEGAVALVRPGGRLVYSTCSLEPEENNGQVAAFLSRHPDFRLASEQQILPNEDHDGAYAALLVSTGG